MRLNNDHFSRSSPPGNPAPHPQTTQRPENEHDPPARVPPSGGPFPGRCRQAGGLGQPPGPGLEPIRKRPYPMATVGDVAQNRDCGRGGGSRPERAVHEAPPQARHRPRSARARPGRRPRPRQHASGPGNRTGGPSVRRAGRFLRPGPRGRVPGGVRRGGGGGPGPGARGIEHKHEY